MPTIQKAESIAKTSGRPNWRPHHYTVRTVRETRESKTSWLGSLLVGEVMTHPAICVEPETQLPAARLLMTEQAIRRLPVVDDGRLVGILTLGDVRGAWASEVSTLNRSELDYLMYQVKVERVMTREPITVSPDTPLMEAARLMIDHKIGGLPVLSDTGQVVGVVTESDVFRTLVELVEIDVDSRTAIDQSQNAPGVDKEST